MVPSKMSPQEFIKNAFSPNVGILHSAAVDKLCKKNNLSFVELLQPFSQITTEVHLQDVNGDEITTQHLKILFSDVHNCPPQPALIHKILNTSVGAAPESKVENIKAGSYSLQIPSYTPWFESWRTSFLNLQYTSDHEFTKHYLACILVVSSSDSNPMEMINQLEQDLNILQTTISNKWFNSSVLKYYCIIHDQTEGDYIKAMECFEAFKVSFEPNNCFLLQLNSRLSSEACQILADPWNQCISLHHNTLWNDYQSDGISLNWFKSTISSVGDQGEKDALLYHPLSPSTELTKLSNLSLVEESSQQNTALHGAFLTLEDIEQIKLFINGFCTKALIPYAERLIQNLNDVVTNRKGVGKSLFIVTKRWFSPGKMGTANGSSSLLIYPIEAPELQFRRLADLYFMFGYYNMAYQIYHACKQDFSADQAWFYYAGVLEMASLAAFMANETTRKTFDYIEEAIVTYLNICKVQQFATRATLFSTECLKACSLHGEAAHQLIRMTSEDSDLFSALLLEQAALCFLESLRPQMVRKYAFHMVLAGHRFSKSSQKKHAVRCYKQALQVYQNSMWAFAEDHVHYTIGKLSTCLKNYEEALKSFSLLLTIQSKQSIDQQTHFLEEYLSIQRTLNDQNNQYSPVLLLPILKSDTLKILVGPAPPLSIPRKVRALGVSFDSNDNPAETQMWYKLEEMIIQDVHGAIPISFKAAVVLYTKHNILNTKVSAIVNELIQVSVVVHNPLSVPLILQDIYLLWEFKDTKEIITTNDAMDKTCSFLMKTYVLKSFLAQNNSSQDLILSITPLIIGELQIKGISYSIYNSYNSEDIVFVTGKQYFHPQQLGLPKGSKFEILITPPAPCLQVTFSEIHSEVLCGEIQLIQMEMRNTGHVPLHKIYIATSKPQLLTTFELYNVLSDFVGSDGSHVQGDEEFDSVTNHAYSIPLPNGLLDIGQTYSINLWVKAPSFIGPINIDLLIYYENSDNYDSRYRFIRHNWKMHVYGSLEVNLKVLGVFGSPELQELIFEVKVTNTNVPHKNLSAKISIGNVTLLSSLWKLKSLGICTKSMILSSQESTRVLLKGLKCITNSANDYIVSMGNYQSFKISTEYMDFGSIYRLNLLKVFDEASYLSKEMEGTLLFDWVAEVNNSYGNEHMANGQTCIFLEKLEYIKPNHHRPTIDTGIVTFPEPPMTELRHEVTFNKLHTQISLCLIYTDLVYHDFKLNSLCIIPIKIVLYNDTAVKSVITINSIYTDRSSFLSEKLLFFNVCPCERYWWFGVNTAIKSVGPLNSEEIMFNITVTSPGIYDLRAFLEIWCQNELHSGQILQSIHSSNFITVQNI